MLQSMWRTYNAKRWCLCTIKKRIEKTFPTQLTHSFMQEILGEDDVFEDNQDVWQFNPNINHGTNLRKVINLDDLS